MGTKVIMNKFLSTMQPLSTDQKIAMLVIPVLLFGVLGASPASAYGRNFTQAQRKAVIEAHTARESGNYKKARAILEQAKLITEHEDDALTNAGDIVAVKRSAVRVAVDAHDYGAFLAAIQGTPFAEYMTPEIFDTLVSAHRLRVVGDNAGAKQLLENAGLTSFA